MLAARFARSKVVLALGMAVLPQLASAEAEDGASFEEVWQAVESDPYDKPAYKVSATRFFGWGVNRLFDAAKRTLNDESDLLPRFDKLLHANGICLKGEWIIDRPSRYTGYFEQGARGLFIGRASVALSETERGHYRSFGIAGKIFPTLDSGELVKTANFFVIDDLGGTLTPRFLDAPLINEPPVSVNTSSILVAPIAAAAATNFSRADANPGLRQVYSISELGLNRPSEAITPRWMRIRGTDGSARIEENDFRDELVVSRYPGKKIEFAIEVAPPTTGNTDKQWRKIGRIVIDDSVVSDSCDHRLHFAHPKFRKDLTY